MFRRRRVFGPSRGDWDPWLDVTLSPPSVDGDARSGKTTVISPPRGRAARMGSIRQTYIKRVAIDLVRHYPDAFTGDFSANKKKVLELTDLATVVDGESRILYKKLANRIAGYATRYVKRKRGT